MKYAVAVLLALGWGLVAYGVWLKTSTPVPDCKPPFIQRFA